MIPVRNTQLERLRSQSFDLLVIGGGSTGSGIALDAASRGLNVALVEANDFASGTSSRSTKLIHGGLRYLESAVKHLDQTQLAVVKEALKERSTLLKLAPHLTRSLPILVPVYSFFDLMTIWVGVKLYDWLAEEKKLAKSHYVSTDKVRQLFPYLKQRGLKGGIILYDGQFDDSRMNLSIALTAASYGAAIANHVECVSLNKGCAVVRDCFTDLKWEISAKVVVNATGPFVDEIRRMDNPQVAPALRPSQGTHILLDHRFTPMETGLLIPKTSDNRLLFMLPWENATLVGTTDVKTEVSHAPKPSDVEISYLLSHLNESLDVSLTLEDIKTSWAGIRPLLDRPDIATTAQLPRDWRIEVTDSGLFSIMGGKWTSYRLMAKDLVDALPFNSGPCTTNRIPLIGGAHYTSNLWQKLPVAPDIAKHLANAYGDRAHEVLKSGPHERLVEGYPYIVAELNWAIEKEYACTVEDIIQRRTHLSFVDQQAADKAKATIASIFGSLPNS